MTDYKSTLQQVCDEIQSIYTRSSSLYDRATTVLMDFGLQFQDAIAKGENEAELKLEAINQLVARNGALQEISGLSDIAYKLSSDLVKALPFSIEFKDVTYYNEISTYGNMMSCILKSNNGISTDIVDFMGNPVMQSVWSNDKANLDSYFRSTFQYGITTETYIETHLVLHYGNNEWDLGVININNIGDETVGYLRIKTNEVKDEQWSVYYNIMQTLVRNKQIADVVTDVASCLSQGDYTKPDIFSMLNKYLNSSYQDVKMFVTDMVRRAGISIQSAIQQFISLFSGKQSIIENEDGTITWKVGSNIISVNLAQSVGSALLQGLQIVGQTMLMMGGVALKVVGGVIAVTASAINSAITAATQSTGVSASINHSASDRIFKYPLVESDYIEIDINTFDPDIKSAILNQLEITPRFKIATPLAYFYFYNIKFINDDIDNGIFSCSIKIFPAITGDGLSTAGRLSGLLINQSVATSSTNAEPYFYLDPQDSITVNQYLHKLSSATQENMFSNEQLDKESLNADKWVEANSSLWTSLYGLFVACFGTTYAHANKDVDDLTHDGGGHYLSNEIYRSPATVQQAIYNLAIIPMMMKTSYYNDMTAANNTLMKIKDNIKDQANSIIYSCLNSFGIVSILDSRVAPHPTEYYDHNFIFNPNEQGGGTWAIEHFTNGMGDGYDRTEHQDFDLLSFNNVAIYALLSPGSLDFRTIIMAAVVSTVIVATVAITIVVARAVTRRRTQARMLEKSAELAKQGKKINKLKSRYSSLTPSAKKEFVKDLKKFEKQVDFYNFVANLTGNQTYDWLNNWYNDPSGAVDAETVKDMQSNLPKVGDNDDAPGIAETIINDPRVLQTISLMTGIPIEKINACLNKDEGTSPDVLLSLDELYKVITGQHYTG